MTIGLKQLSLAGWKTIKTLPELTFGPLNVFIGANGAGKSNLISFFRMLNWLSGCAGDFQGYVARYGGANTILHDGAAHTPRITTTLTIATAEAALEYGIDFAYAAPDTLFFVEEKYRLRLPGSSGYSDWQIAGGGYKESLVIERARGGDPIAQIIRKLLRRCIVHQFHNTSETARIRQRWDTHDARYLKEDGGNLAPVLLRLREEKPQAYRRIIDTVRLVVPFFADFFLEPSNGSVFLQWTEKGTDVVFGAHQASDGTLRTLALITLLLQPIEDVPDVLILDEPELGLHPYAVTVIAGLIKSISLHRQVLLATQSITLLNQFAPEDVIVVNRRGRESEFTRLDPQGLSEWIEEYSLGELWEKNVIGGRPHR